MRRSESRICLPKDETELRHQEGVFQKEFPQNTAIRVTKTSGQKRKSNCLLIDETELRHERGFPKGIPPNIAKYVEI